MLKQPDKDLTIYDMLSGDTHYSGGFDEQDAFIYIYDKDSLVQFN